MVRESGESDDTPMHTSLNATYSTTADRGDAAALAAKLARGCGPKSGWQDPDGCGDMK